MDLRKKKTLNRKKRKSPPPQQDSDQDSSDEQTEQVAELQDPSNTPSVEPNAAENFLLELDTLTEQIPKKEIERRLQDINSYKDPDKIKWKLCINPRCDRKRTYHYMYKKGHIQTHVNTALKRREGNANKGRSKSPKDINCSKKDDKSNDNGNKAEDSVKTDKEDANGDETSASSGSLGRSVLSVDDGITPIRKSSRRKIILNYSMEDEGKDSGSAYEEESSSDDEVLEKARRSRRSHVIHSKAENDECRKHKSDDGNPALGDECEENRRLDGGCEDLNEDDKASTGDVNAEKNTTGGATRKRLAAIKSRKEEANQFLREKYEAGSLLDDKVLVDDVFDEYIQRDMQMFLTKGDFGKAVCHVFKTVSRRYLKTDGIRQYWYKGIRRKTDIVTNLTEQAAVSILDEGCNKIQKSIISKQSPTLETKGSDVVKKTNSDKEKIVVDVFGDRACSICWRMFNLNQHALNHIQHHHNTKATLCRLCKAVFPTRHDAYIHEGLLDCVPGKINGSLKKWVCRRNCGRTCSSKTRGLMLQHEDHSCPNIDQPIQEVILADSTRGCGGCSQIIFSNRLKKHDCDAKKDYTGHPLECELCRALGMGRFISANINKFQQHHQTVHTFSCHRCNVHHKTAAELVDHVKEKHLEEPLKCYVCEVCDIVTTDEGLLACHKFTRHGMDCEPPRTCPRCAFMFSGLEHARAKAYKLHYRSKHATSIAKEPIGHTCEKCQDTFYRPESLSNHMAKCDGIVKCTCYKCNFSVSYPIHRHARVCRGVSAAPLQCPFCTHMASSCQQLRIHKLCLHSIYEEGTAVDCPECLRKFPNKESFAAHATLHNLIQKQICDGGGILKYMNKEKTDYYGTRKCGKCSTCNYVITRPICPVGDRSYEIKGFFTCDTKGLIYKISCSYPGCNEFYIGLTRNKLKRRICNHLRSVLDEGVNTKAHRHFRSAHGENGLAYFNVEVLYHQPKQDRANWDRKLQTAEAMYIEDAKAKMSLNMVNGCWKYDNDDEDSDSDFDDDEENNEVDEEEVLDVSFTKD